MRAITVRPGQAGSAQLDDRPEPVLAAGDLLVETLALGVCGTDREILQGLYGEAPPGGERLVLGHESLGRVLHAPPGCRFAPGDHVAGVVRRPDPVPCQACAAGEWDMCRNGLYTERGIKGLDGYGAERFSLEPAFAVQVDPALGLRGVLLEPASVLAKAWDHIDRVGGRTRSWSPERVLVTGAGPVGLLAAHEARRRGLETHVFDRTEEGLKPQLVRDIGAVYHCSGFPEDLAPDIILECTGAPPVVTAALTASGPNGVVCLTGISSGGRTIAFDTGGFNREVVLQNDVIFGSVNANLAHYRAAAQALAASDPDWLDRIINRRTPLARWAEAYERRPGDVKVIVDFGRGEV